MNAEEIKTALCRQSAEDYRAFSQRLIPTSKPILGVRMPVLRKMAATLAKEDWAAYARAPHETYEETLLAGLAVAAAVCARGFAIEPALAAVSAFLPEIDNWAVCDSFCASLKLARRYPEAVWSLVSGCAASERLWDRRFAAVMVNFHLVTQEQLERSLALLGGMRADEYYVSMAVAWASATCYCKFPAQTLPWLTDCPLDDATFRRTLRKITESRLPDVDQKRLIRSLRRKTN